METHKEPQADLKAAKLVNELINMHSYLHTNNVLRKVFRIKERPEREVKLELLTSLNKIAQDETGESALRFVDCTMQCMAGKEKIIELSSGTVNLEPDVRFTIMQNPSTSESQASSITLFPFISYQKTEDNMKKALEIVVRMSKNIEAEEKEFAAWRRGELGGIHNIT
ncbi:MAG: hypothetical protein ABSD68_00465 [Candidatus Micrarchaeales archaeon]|jgi:hypothetical protein